MLRKLTELRILKAIVDLSSDSDNTDTDKIHFINDTLFNILTPVEVDKFTKIFFAYPGFELAFTSKRPPRHDLDFLSTLPENTFGWEYARFMRVNNFVIDWYPPMGEKSPLHFARNRMYQSHDLLHTITGFGSGSFNEMALQGFCAGQEIPNATTMSTIAAAALNLLRDNSPQRSSKFLDYLLTGYQMGKDADKIVFYNWEDYFQEDINDLRKRLKVTIPSNL
jgi:ubiquinone biosynthesis protein Coq4